MTKRPSPFEPTICRQSKIHLNNYENDLIALRDVEERTLKKLLDGSRKLHSIILNNGIHLDSNENKLNSKSNIFMQKLVTNYFTVNGRKINENVNNVQVNSSETLSKCCFCDSRTNSIYQCPKCLEFYCSSCSFDNYESLEDKRICLSCS